MKAWILSIVGVVFLGVMVDIISPEGKTNSFIKSIFALVLLYVIVQPLLAVITKGVTVTSSWTGGYDTKLMQTINDQKINEMRLRILDALNAEGYTQYDVNIRANLSQNENDIEQISVYYTGDVLLSSDEHIHNSKVIQQIICEVTNASKEVVVFE